MVDVRLDGVVKRYGDQVAVDHVDLEIPSGSFVTLLGPSGCGKTTTLRSIAGLEDPDEGSIRLGERVVVDVSRRILMPPERRKVGMVFQSYALWPHMTVAQNVAYPLRRQHLDRTTIQREVTSILDLVNLGELRDRSVAALSGGQQQRVALARAMVGSPALTLFDEPLSNIDVRLRNRMRVEIRRLHERIGMTSVYVTHDQSEAFALSDVVVVMSAGRIQQIGSPQEVYLRPANAFVADFVGFENRLEGQRVSGKGGPAIRLSGGSRLPLTGDLPDGELVVYARADAVSVRRREGSLAIGSGRVLGVTYLGDSYEFHVETEHGVVIGRDRAELGTESSRIRAGDRVELQLDPAQAVTIAATTTRGKTSRA